MGKRLVCAVFLFLAACGGNDITPGSGGSGGGSGGSGGGSGGSGGSGGGGGPPGGGGHFPPNGIAFPWPVFDGTVPDTPPSATGHTWYVDAAHGSDSNNGMTMGTAKKTLHAALTISGLAAGDTILMAGGIYREYPGFSNAPSGQMGAPLTIGSYGHGTGAPILDGGLKLTWTKYTAQGQTTVWQASTTGTKITGSTVPALGIYVNNGTDEFALREVIHGQVRAYPNESLPPNQNQTNITDNSNNWYYDPSGQILYADFGGTLGTNDPNAADVSVLYNSENGPSGHELLVYLSSSHNYFTFSGITFRAGSWSAVYSEASGLVFDHCDFKFNGGAAILFAGPSGATALPHDNTVTMSRIWMNILHNWPRFNNGYTGGGWPAAIDWADQTNGLSEGNVVYLNGGEGMTLGQTDYSGLTSTGNHELHNIIFDNFSVNMYLNNTEGGLVEENFVFQHPRDETQTFTGLFEASPGYNGDYGRRIEPILLSAGDEPGSSYDHAAHLSNMTIINNIFAGGKFSMLDYDDGTTGTRHGLRNCVISNNTFILNSTEVPGGTGYGWQHITTGDTSTGTVMHNNLFVTGSSDDRFVRIGPTTGIDFDYNLYGGPGSFFDGNMVAFTAWKSAHAPWDAHSMSGNAMLVDVSEFNQTYQQKFVYDWSKARPMTGSPALGNGTTTANGSDFTGGNRSGMDIGALGAQ